SYIGLAAPGGNTDFGLVESGQLADYFGITAPAYFKDYVFTTYYDLFPDRPDIHIAPTQGTSFSGPHVAGAAALVIEAAGGQMDPDEVFGILKQSADDLGEPGKDAFFGHGRVNAAAAVALALGHEHHGHGGHAVHAENGPSHGHHAQGGPSH